MTEYASGPTSAQGARHHHIKIRVFLMALALSSILAINFLGTRSDHCWNCGMRRSVFLRLLPCEQHTATSRVLLPLLPGGICEHKWVPGGSNPLVGCTTINHGPFARQEAVVASGGFALSIQAVAKRDSELACEMARAVLRAFRNPKEFDRRLERFSMIANTEICFAEDQDIARFRGEYGLPRKGH